MVFESSTGTNNNQPDPGSDRLREQTKAELLKKITELVYESKKIGVRDQDLGRVNWLLKLAFAKAQTVLPPADANIAIEFEYK